MLYLGGLTTQAWRRGDGGMFEQTGRTLLDAYELLGLSHWRKLPKELPVEIGDGRTFFPIGMDYCNGTTGFYRKGIPPLTLHDMIGINDRDYPVPWRHGP